MRIEKGYKIELVVTRGIKRALKPEIVQKGHGQKSIFNHLSVPYGSPNLKNTCGTRGTAGADPCMRALLSQKLYAFFKRIFGMFVTNAEHRKNKIF